MESSKLTDYGGIQLYFFKKSWLFLYCSFHSIVYVGLAILPILLFDKRSPCYCIVVSISYQLHVLKSADYFSLQGQAFKRGRSNSVLRSDSNFLHYQYQRCGFTFFFHFKHFIQQACLQDSSSWKCILFLFKSFPL